MLTDVDGSGEQDKYELKGLCTELGIGINVKQLKSAWKWMDKDGDGRIELAEFDWWLFGDKSGAIFSLLRGFFMAFFRDGFVMFLTVS